MHLNEYSYQGFSNPRLSDSTDYLKNGNYFNIVYAQNKKVKAKSGTL